MRNFNKKPRINKILIVLILLFFSGINLIEAQTRAERLRKLYLENKQSDTQNKDRVWIMAHRGVWDEQAPESSVAAFRNAVDLKFEIIELDVSFSAEYTYEDNECIPVVNPDGTRRNIGKKEVHRAIIFTHDPNSGRVRGNDGKVGFGLYNYSHTVKNTPKPFKKSGEFIMLQNLVPYNLTNENVIVEQTTSYKRVEFSTSPKLLTLDGKLTDHRLIMYNPAKPIYKDFFGYLKENDPFNRNMYEFAKYVRDKVLINIDKLKTKEDFRAVYSLMKDTGLLNQCIFKAKGIKSLGEVYDLFGDKLKEGGQILFTPTFTEFDLDKDSGNCIDENTRYTQMKARWDAINLSEADHGMLYETRFPPSVPVNQGGLPAPNVGYKRIAKYPIAIAGAEVVFTKDYSPQDTNKPNYFLTRLAADIIKDGKRVVQFGALPESKKGAWTGGQAKWMGEGKYSKNNFWEFIYDNTNLSKIGEKTVFSDVYVGDKPIEFRAYMNALGYNMKPID